MYLTIGLSCHGFHPAAWRVSSAFSPFDMGVYRDLVQKADQSSFDVACLGASTGGADLFLSGLSDAYDLDALPVSGALAATTHRIGLGALVPLSQTHPFHTARAFSVLDHLSGGRAAWVIPPMYEDEGADTPAPGHPVLAPEQWYDRAAEYILVAKKLWDSWEDRCVLADKDSGIFADSTRVHPIDHVGEYFSVQGPLTAVRPLQGHPLIIQHDRSDRGLKLAAETADVFIATCGTPAEAIRLREELASFLDAAKRPRGAVKFLVSIFAVLGDTEGDASRLARQLDELSSGGLQAAQALHREKHGLPDHRWGISFTGTALQLHDVMKQWTTTGLCDGFNIMPAVLPDGIDSLFSEIRRERRGTQSPILRSRFGLHRPIGQYRREAPAHA